MKQEDLVQGLKFAQKYNLTQRETETLLCFLEKDSTAAQVADQLGVKSLTTMHHMIGRLKLKNLLILKDVDKKGTNTYQFNLDSLDN